MAAPLQFAISCWGWSLALEPAVGRRPQRGRRIGWGWSLVLAGSACALAARLRQRPRGNFFGAGQVRVSKCAEECVGAKKKQKTNHEEKRSWKGES